MKLKNFRLQRGNWKKSYKVLISTTAGLDEIFWEHKGAEVHHIEPGILQGLGN